MLSDLENRARSVVYQSDAGAALGLAKEWQRQGRANWFRGQVFPWPPHSSLFRWQQQSTSGKTLSTQAALHRFRAWAVRRPELSNIAENDSQITAVAQHFGVPTNYIDFSLSPEVAALFARDRLADATYSLGHACIYCLSTDDMYTWWCSLSRSEAEALQVYPDSVDLPALHRLTAQLGVFLHAPGPWDERLKPDIILFPRGPVLTPEEHLRLYPPTSKLEEDVLAFLQGNNTHEWMEWVGRTWPTSVVHLRPPDPEIRNLCFAGGLPEPAPGWPVQDEQWLVGMHRAGGDSLTIRWPPQTERMANWMFASAIRHQLSNVLDNNPSLSRRSLELQILPTAGLLEEPDASRVSKCLTRAWNAMEAFPYSISQRLESFEQILQLGSEGLGSWKSGREEELARMTSGRGEDEDRWIKLTLGGSNGASSTGLARFGTLVGALRPDLRNVLSDEGLLTAMRDPIDLMGRVRDPSLIFDFEGLLRCFVEELIPTQTLLMGAGLPLFFSPAQLIYLGSE